MMQTRCSTILAHGGPRRRGAVLLIVLICLLLMSMVGGSLLKLATAQRKQMRREQLRAQANWLAEAGIERAAAHLAHDASYAGETWMIAADQIDGKRAAVVRIEVSEPASESLLQMIEAVAEYPVETMDQARVRKQVFYQPSSSQFGTNHDSGDPQ